MVQNWDGRRLEVLTSGADDGLPLVFHTGTPGGLLAAFPAMAKAEAARGCGPCNTRGPATASPHRSRPPVPAGNRLARR